MKLTTTRRGLIAALGCLALAGCKGGARGASDAARAEPEARVVSAGGAVTEVVVALGARSRLVGVDVSSTFPADLRALPQVGYVRTLSAEGVLSLRPTLLLTTSEAGPPAAMQQLRESGLRVEAVPATPTVEGAKERVRRVARALGRVREGDALIATMERELQESRAARPARSPRVVFILARGGGSVMVAGRETAADEMIRQAGGVNAVTAWEGYRPLTAEALATAAPDVLLTTTAGLASVGGVDGVRNLPGAALTPAVRDGHVVAMEDLYLLGLGPRVGRAVGELARRFSEATR